MRKLALLLALLTAATACDTWVDEPLEDTPQNLNLGVITVSLREHPDKDPAASEEEAREEIALTSELWQRRCGIRLTHAAHFVVDAKQTGFAYKPKSYAEAHAIQEALYNPNYVTIAFVGELNVGQASKDTATVGLGSWPNDPDRATLIARMGLGNFVAAHELGHDFGLEHTDQDEWVWDSVFNLMNQVYRGALDPELRTEQCELAKSYILEHTRFEHACRPDSDAGSVYCLEPQAPYGTVAQAAEEPNSSPRAIERPLRLQQWQCDATHSAND